MIQIEELYRLFVKTKRVFTDTRQAQDGGIFFALKGANFDGNDFIDEALKQGAHYAVSNQERYRGNDRVYIVDDVLATLQELATFHRRKCSIPVLAITGTNGKTTTKELITHVLAMKYNVVSTQGNLNNHIGVPLTLLRITQDHEFAVIEMGANHPGEIEFLSKIAEPDFGIITNVGRAHLEGFGSFEGVKKTKGELYHYIAKSGKGIFINTGNSHLVGMVPAHVEKFTYAVSGTDAQLNGTLANQEILMVCKVLFPKGWLYIKTNLTGAYNLENVLAACRIGMHFGIEPLLIQKGIELYKPDNFRSQVVKLENSMVIVDCYNANPSSMEASIRNFSQINKGAKTLILGDMLELGDDSVLEHQKIVDLVVDLGFDDVYWIGKSFYTSGLPANSKKFKNIDDMLSVFDKQPFKDRFILIKGSRGIRLEKILDLLK